MKKMTLSKPSLRRPGRHQVATPAPDEAAAPSETPGAADENQLIAAQIEDRMRSSMGKDVVREPLRATGAHRHLLNTPDGVWAFFVQGEQDIQYKQSRDRHRTFVSGAHRWADLVGHEVFETGISVPYPVKSWAQRVDREHPGHLDDVEGACTWADKLVAGQQHMHDLDARKSATVLGVRISDDKVPDTQLAQLLSTQELVGRMGGLDKVRRTLNSITKAVDREGFGALPMSARSLGWLIHSSLGMGAPVPATILGQGLRWDDAAGRFVPTDGSEREGWADEDLPGFTNPVHAESSPYSLTTRVRVVRDSVQYDNHIAILHGDEFSPRDYDHEEGPYLAWCHTLDEPVRFVRRGYIVPGDAVKDSATTDRRRAKNIAEHWEEHDDDPPPAIERGIQRAREVEDEVTSHRREVSTRFRGVVMFAVVAPSEEDCLQKARDLSVSMANKQGITLAHDYGQYAYYRAFTPGESCPMTGHLTQQPVGYLAMGMPHASTSGGDPTGFLVGNIAGGPDVFTWDLFGGARRDRSNVVGFGGAQGTGKSSLMCALMDWAAHAGIRTVGNDPSGPMAALTQMPHLKSDARHLDLSSARRGTLIPHLMIPEPRPEDYDPASGEYHKAVETAATDRTELCVDALKDLLPYGMVDPDVLSVIEDAVASFRGVYGTNPWDIVDLMATKGGDVGQKIAARLATRAEMKAGRLIFPERGKEADDDYIDRLMNQATLTIVTMSGLQLAPKGRSNRGDWTSEQQASVPILNLGTRFATRVMYADKSPKVIMNDELGLSTTGESSLTALLTRASYDSRKWQALLGLAFQNPNLLMGLDDQITNLLGSVWIGRMDGAAATGALPLLRLPENQGWEEVIEGLNQAEFVVRHWDRKQPKGQPAAKDRIRKVRVDRDWWHPDLIAATDTTPGEAYDETGAELFDGVA